LRDRLARESQERDRRHRDACPAHLDHRSGSLRRRIRVARSPPPGHRNQTASIVADLPGPSIAERGGTKRWLRAVARATHRLLPRNYDGAALLTPDSSG